MKIPEFLDVYKDIKQKSLEKCLSEVLSKLLNSKENLVFMVNPMEVQKIGDLFLMESRFYKLARNHSIFIV